MNRITKKISGEIGNNPIRNEKDYFVFHEHRFDHIFSLLSGYDKDNALLDVGSHYLHGLFGAHCLGFRRIFGADIEYFNSASASRAESIGALIKNCDLARENIPFDDESFDIVVLAETLEHFNFHPRKVFLEISRVLRPGGELIITTPNLLRLNNRLKCVLGRSINSDIKEDYTPGTHYREYSAAEIKYLLEASGLTMKSLKYADFNYPDRGRLEAIMNKTAGTLAPGLKSNIVVIGKKRSRKK